MDEKIIKNNNVKFVKWKTTDLNILTYIKAYRGRPVFGAWKNLRFFLFFFEVNTRYQMQPQIF
jgi:hypothetical protein